MKIRKRKANLIPFRRFGSSVEVYLSRRSKTAIQFPNMWSFWGGSIQDRESPEQALIREIKEELVYKPSPYKFLGIYHDIAPNEKYVFYTEVGDGFENEIEIKESQGGKFFSREEIKTLLNLVPGDEIVLNDLFALLEGR